MPDLKKWTSTSQKCLLVHSAKGKCRISILYGRYPGPLWTALQPRYYCIMHGWKAIPAAGGNQGSITHAFRGYPEDWLWIYQERHLQHIYAISSLYRAFPAPEARRIAKRLEIHYTPKHGSWLDIAEIELNVMARQCLSRRIKEIILLRQELAAWESDRNKHTSYIQWQFTTDNARIKLI